MASAKVPAVSSGGFDVLKFFCMVMGLLTVVVGLVGAVLFRRYREESAQASRAYSQLLEVHEIASDDEFRRWLRDERANGRGPDVGYLPEFITNAAQQTRVSVLSRDEQQPRFHRTYTERSYRLTFRGVVLQNLVAFLDLLQSDWPGLRVMEVSISDWDANRGGWEARVTVSVFRLTEAETP